MARRRPVNGTRLKVLMALGSGKSLTAQEIADACGVTASALTGMVQRMHADRWLGASSDPDPPTRGTTYHLGVLGRQMLEQALAEERPVGTLEVGQWAVMVVLGSTPGRNLAFQTLMSDARRAGLVEWAAKFGRDHLLVLGRDVDSFQVTGLVSALEALGSACYHGQLGTLLSGSDLRRQAMEHIEEAQRVA